MKTTMYKSQGRTFKEVHMEFNEDEYTTRDLGFVPDPFFTEHMKTLEDLQKKQRESGLEFDMEKVKDPAIIYFDEILADGDKLYIDWVKRREARPELQGLPKATMFHDEVQVERKHPYIFKITDLVEDPAEFIRLEMRLESDRQFEEYYGFKMAPIFVEAIPDANVIARSVNDTMKKLFKLSVEYKVEIYFGTKAALKPLLYQFMYGARRADMDLSKVEEISVEKAEEMVDKQTKVAILGGHGLGFGNMAKLLADHYSEEARMVESFDTWNFKDFAAAAKAEKPARDWEQGKLRRGKGHNKFKRKGKK